ncbi:HprK-related kinase A [Methylococcus sp. EFPC2]|uniref:HprK-related kinase A n=1 Tax=Methylococcus sp. EFPC2 TaxID=2812648 RepID=UPI0019678AB8|nr:HprK-related kinase A [Methylococcus sp. EFPC2]QSA95516.1 HprK-related kinase A [Methylococcus sp. EFPC2]
MTLDRFSERELAFLLSKGGLVLHIGAFSARLKSNSSSFAAALFFFYGRYPVEPDGVFADFHLGITRPQGLRGWIKPQVVFARDGQALFDPFPADHAAPMFEWGLNWSIAHLAHRFLLLHSAVLEKNGRVLLLPAHPGSGKSTLCAALTLSGWRLLSDEFGMVDRDDLALVPQPRPVALKNRSIDVIRERFPLAPLGPSFPKTRKGTVAHLRADANSVARMREKAMPAWIVFPRFREGASLTLQPYPKARSFLRLANNSFNYELLGEAGFRTVAGLIRRCACYSLEFGCLDDALSALADLERGE